jgi:hypothetical protein
MVIGSVVFAICKVLGSISCVMPDNGKNPKTGYNSRRNFLCDMIFDRRTKEIFKRTVFFDIRPAGKAVIYIVIYSCEEPSVVGEQLFGSNFLRFVEKSRYS